MLERSRAQVVNWGCSRSEDTFDDVVPSSPYEGGFIVNVSGPVRAIRSYIGANSGTYTAATDIFYPTREDSTIQLQVHPIPGVSAFDDLNTAAQGLTYHDDENPQGVTIDGTPDTLTENHPATWQLVRGLQGSLVTTRSIDSDIAGLTLSTYYLDQNPASPPPCTGDAAAWGQFGTTVVGPGGTLPCTDPTLYGTSGCPTIPGQATANFLEATRTRYFEPPSFSINKAADLSASTANPLQTTVSG
jgi:hypothetical protein